VKAFPAGVRDDVGYALYAAQFGEMSPKAKPHYLASWQQSGEAREVRQDRYLPNREIVRGWWAAATAKGNRAHRPEGQAAQKHRLT
jgi:hypothetical protein